MKTARSIHVATYLRSDRPEHGAILALLADIPAQRRAGYIRACLITATDRARSDLAFARELALRADLDLEELNALLG